MAVSIFLICLASGVLISMLILNPDKITDQEKLKKLTQAWYLPESFRTKALMKVTDNDFRFMLFKKYLGTQFGETAFDGIDSDIPIINFLILEAENHEFRRENLISRLIGEIDNKNRLAYMFTQVKSQNIAKLILEQIEDKSLLFDVMHMCFISEGHVQLLKRRITEL